MVAASVIFDATGLRVRLGIRLRGALAGSSGRAVPGKPAAAPDRNDDSVSRTLAGPAAAMASEKSVTGGENRPAAQ